MRYVIDILVNYSLRTGTISWIFSIGLTAEVAEDTEKNRDKKGSDSVPIPGI